MKQFSVSIHDCSVGKITNTVNIEETDSAAAKNSAIQRIYGDGAFFQVDNGLGPRYGQVFKSLGVDRAATSCSPRIRIDVDEIN